MPESTRPWPSARPLEWKGIACATLAALPAAALLVAILRCAVDVPFLDEWDYLQNLYDPQTHSLDLFRFFEQHNEHRMAFPRLVYFAVNVVSRGDVRFQMIATFLMACVISLNFLWLHRTLSRAASAPSLLLLAIANLLIFSPVQHENWLWGFQACMVSPFFAVSTCMVIAVSRLNAPAKFGLCMILCACSSLSLANGMAAWVAVLPVLLVHCAESPRTRNCLAVAWVAAALALAAGYAHNYQQPAIHPDVMFAASHPFQAAEFFLVLLAAPLTTHIVGVSPMFPAAVGGLAFLLMLLAAGYSIRFWGDAEVRRESVVWMAIGGQGIMSCLLMTVGRAGWGLDYATSSRYTTASLIALVSLAYLGTMALKDAHRRWPGALTGANLDRILCGAATALVSMHIQAAVFSAPHWESRYAATLRTKALTTFLHVARIDPSIVAGISGFPDSAFRKDAAWLDSHNYLHPPMAKTDALPPILEDSTGRVHGCIDSMKAVGDQIVVEGWAVLPDRPADGVLICWAKPNGPRHVFQLTFNVRQRQDIVAALNDHRFLLSGWSAVASHDQVPQDATEITAWAFDAELGGVYPLPMVH